MDEEVREPLRKARLVAWLAAGLLAAGVVSVGAVNAQNEAEDSRVVAAGQDAGGVEVPTTLGDFVPPLPSTSVPPPPTTVAAPTTTAAPKPTPTAPPTTRPARTTTTKPAVTATTSTPTTAAQSTSVTVNVVNEHPLSVNVKVNGKAFTLSPGQQSGPVTVPRSDGGNDTVEVGLVQDPSCATGDAGGYFPKPGGYRLTVIASRGTCQGGVPGPDLRVTPA